MGHENQAARPELLLRLARAQFTDEHKARVGALFAAAPNWARLVQQTVQHGVIPLVYRNLKCHFSDQVPKGVLSALSRLYHVRLYRSIQIRGELPRLLSHLKSRGVDAVPFKGPVLAQKAYSDENLRTFTDLDVLIHQRDVEPAISALHDAGFKEKNPLPARIGTRWSYYTPFHHPHANANGYVRGADKASKLHVDLHWGLASRYFLFPMDPEGIWTRLEPVTLEDGERYQTFSPEDTLLFLCMHGTKDAWHKLSLVCDVAELIRAYPDLDYAWVIDQARTLQSERMVLVALRLAHTLLDAPLPARVRSLIASDPVVSGLTAQVVRLLFGKPNGIARYLRTCAFYIRVRDRYRDGIGTVLYHTGLVLQPTREDRDWIELPKGLNGLYFLIRPLRKLVQSVRVRPSTDET